MEIVLQRDNYIVCVKPAGALSTDEPAGVPELLRVQTGLTEIYPIHRLDRVVGGLMLCATGKEAAAELGSQLMDRRFGKEYLAVIHGCPEELKGSMRDYLERDRRQCMTLIAPGPGKYAREAILDYEILASRAGLSLAVVQLRTGRTHQIRVQFSSRGYPLAGDRKYGLPGDGEAIGLWSFRLAFDDPHTGERISLCRGPGEGNSSFSAFSDIIKEREISYYEH